MNLKNEFTEPECQRFRELCNFTPDELAVFNLRVRAKSVIEIAEKLHLSEATVNRRLKGIKTKIIKVL
jgi:DNA-binding NarL/FixJ family response regulator